MVVDLQSRPDLNNHAAVVLDMPRNKEGRVGVRMILAKYSFWAKRESLIKIPDTGAMTAGPFLRMSVEERAQVGVDMDTAAPAPPARRPPLGVNMDGPDRDFPWVAPPAPAPAPAPVDRRAAARAALQRMASEHCPRPHYCIFCGAEGLLGSKCMEGSPPCGFYRGTYCFPPNGPLQKGDTYMGRKLAYVSWPWQGDPDAPYIRAGAGAAFEAPRSEPEPELKYPDSDADEEAVEAYLAAKVAQLQPTKDAPLSTRTTDIASGAL